MVEIFSIIITFVAIIFLVLLIILPKKIGYALAGIVLIILGLFPLFHALHYISFDLHEYPILDFLIYFIIAISGKDLFKEGLKEKMNNSFFSKYVKFPSIFFGLFIIVLTTIPKLYKHHVIDWTIPSYPPIFDVVLYVVCGIFLLLGVFSLFDDPKY